MIGIDSTGKPVAPTPLRIVETATAADETGKRVPAIPIRYVDAAVDTETDAPLEALQAEIVSDLVVTTADGRVVGSIPARVVAGLVTTDEAGRPQAVVPVWNIGEPVAPTFANMPAMNAALDTLGRAVLVMPGDSTTLGYGWSGLNQYANCAENNAAAALAAELTSLGFNTTIDCYQFYDVTSYDPDVSGGGDWTLYSGPPATSPWGGYVKGTVSTTSQYTIQGRLPWDTCEIFYDTGPAGYGTMKVDRGGAAQSVSGVTGSVTISRSVLTFPLGTEPVNIYAATTSDFIVPRGIRLYNSTTPRLVILDALGWGGSATANWIDAASNTSPFPGLLLLHAHGFKINLGINDKIASVAAATFKTNLKSLINQGLAADAPGIALPPDVVVEIPNDCANAGAGQFDSAYRTAVTEAATETGIRAPFDIQTAFPYGTYSAEYSDPTHPLKVLYDRIGAAEANWL